MSLIAEGTGKVSVPLAFVELGKEVATTCSSSQQSCSLKQFCEHSEVIFQAKIFKITYEFVLDHYWKGGQGGL